MIPHDSDEAGVVLVIPLLIFFGLILPLFILPDKESKAHDKVVTEEVIVYDYEIVFDDGTLKDFQCSQIETIGNMTTYYTTDAYDYNVCVSLDSGLIMLKYKDNVNVETYKDGFVLKRREE